VTAHDEHGVHSTHLSRITQYAPVCPAEERHADRNLRAMPSYSRAGALDFTNPGGPSSRPAPPGPPELPRSCGAGSRTRCRPGSSRDGAAGSQRRSRSTHLHDRVPSFIVPRAWYPGRSRRAAGGAAERYFDRRCSAGRPRPGTARRAWARSRHRRRRAIGKASRRVTREQGTPISPAGQCRRPGIAARLPTSSRNLRNCQGARLTTSAPDPGAGGRLPEDAARRLRSALIAPGGRPESCDGTRRRWRGACGDGALRSARPRSGHPRCRTSRAGQRRS
jgi:hypothetical protein